MVFECDEYLHVSLEFFKISSATDPRSNLREAYRFILGAYLPMDNLLLSPHQIKFLSETLTVIEYYSFQSLVKIIIMYKPEPVHMYMVVCISVNEFNLTYCDKKATSDSVLWQSWFVLESCSVVPFTRHLIPRLWGSEM